MAKDKINAGIVSISGNVKNGLIYYSAPPSTGGLPNRSVMRCGGKKKCDGRKKAPWGTDIDGNQVWITDDGRIFNPEEDFEVMLANDFVDIPNGTMTSRYMYPNNDALNLINTKSKTDKINKDNNKKNDNLNAYKINTDNLGVVYHIPEMGYNYRKINTKDNINRTPGPNAFESLTIPTLNISTPASIGISTTPDTPSVETPASASPSREQIARTSTPATPRYAERNPIVVTPNGLIVPEANLDPGKVPASVVKIVHRQAADARQYGEYAGVTPRDWMSLAGNVAGSIGNWLATRNSPRITIAEPNRPFIEMPVRLKTNYNNRPQIANVEEQARRNYQNIRENTASSSAALARMQRVRNAATQNINELEAQRENIETQLTNADRTNRQQVRARNARAMNQYYENLASARTRQSIADAQRKSANQAALSNLFNNVNLSFQDFLGRMNRRESFNNTLAYLRAANPNYDDRMFKDNGANFINMYLQGLNELVHK